ncbi:hypothetical protein EJ02DRAFT_137613 [Clathrospora elynae]|uniref:Uncharacterized protein n=1 Tax=Clathrospora elynae TaxID=706981 RepID=A0A6A5T3Q6_9PLEO|nr:hypothetical protein EJ02DRAFT_137613 [Clathrospora elynae]
MKTAFVSVYSERSIRRWGFCKVSHRQYHHHFDTHPRTQTCMPYSQNGSHTLTKHPVYPAQRDRSISFASCHSTALGRKRSQSTSGLLPNTQQFPTFIIHPCPFFFRYSTASDVMLNNTHQLQCNAHTMILGAKAGKSRIPSMALRRKHGR